MPNLLNLNVAGRAGGVLGSIFPGLTTPGTVFGDMYGSIPQTGNINRFYNALAGKSAAGGLFGLGGGGDSAYRLQRNYLFDIVLTFNPATSQVYKAFKQVLVSFSADSIRYLIQRIDIPDIELTEGPEHQKTQFGYGVLPGRYLLPSNNILSIDLLNGENSLIDKPIYYWMKELASTEWQYPDRPYTTANIYISFLDQQDITRLHRYVFTGVVPSSIGAPKISQEPDTADSFIRTIKFNFTNVIIGQPTKLSVATKLITSILGGKNPVSSFTNVLGARI